MPTRIEEQINRVDPTRALAIGIASVLTALWCGYRLIWLIYTATTNLSPALDETALGDAISGGRFFG